MFKWLFIILSKKYRGVIQYFRDSTCWYDLLQKKLTGVHETEPATKLKAFLKTVSMCKDQDLWQCAQGIEGEREWRGSIFGLKVAFNARGLVCDKPTISTSCGKMTEAAIQPSLVGASAVRITNHKIVLILQDSAAPGRKGVGMQGNGKGMKRAPRRTPTLLYR